MIEALIDLANLKLIARFQDVLTASAATSQTTDTGTQPKQHQQVGQKWMHSGHQRETWIGEGYLDKYFLVLLIIPTSKSSLHASPSLYHYVSTTSLLQT